MSRNTRTGNAGLLTVLLFGGFVVTGVVTTILGPILPVFISRWSLNDAQAGFFFTTQFTGSLVGVMLSSFLISTRGFRATLIAGYLLMAVGIGALVSNNSSAVLLAAAIYGMAYGLVVPATNLCVAEQAGKKQSAALSLLNLAWSVGSLVCPVIVRYGVRTAKLNFLILLIASAAALLALMAVVSDSRQFPEQTTTKPAVANAPVIRGKETWWAAVFLALLFFIYVGTENAVSGWSAAFSKRLADSGSAPGELAPMYFFSGLLAGRLLAPAILKHVQEVKLASIGMLTAAFGIAIFLRSYTRPLAMAGFVIAGAGLSALYPIFIAWLAWAFGARSRRIGGVMFAMGSTGGATLPWLVGAISSRSGSLRAGLFVPFAGCLLMFLLAAMFRRTAHPGANAGSSQ